MAFVTSTDSTDIATIPAEKGDESVTVQQMDLSCDDCNENPCQAIKVAAALTLGPLCLSCRAKIKECACNVKIERGVLVNLAKSSPIKDTVPLRVFWVTVKSGGETLEGIPKASFPHVLFKDYLTDEKHKGLKEKFGNVLEQVNDLTPWCTIRLSKGTNNSLVTPKDNATKGKRFRFVRLHEFDEYANLAQYVMPVFNHSATEEEKRRCYGMLAKYFERVGEIFLALVCEELHHGKMDMNSNQETLIKRDMAEFCGVDYSSELKEVVKKNGKDVKKDITKKAKVVIMNAFDEIQAGRKQMEYDERAEECWRTGNLVLAMLFKQLSCSIEMGPARKEFILHFLKDMSKNKTEWKNPSDLLTDAMREASGQKAAHVAVVPEFESEALCKIARSGDAKVKQWDEETVEIKRSVLEEIMRFVSTEQVDEMLKNKKRRLGGTGDIAYLLHSSDKSLESGDVVYVVYGEDGSVTCTKRKPSDPSAIFGRSVVAGAGNLEPYMVASPHGVSEASGVKVVYLGHAFVKVHEHDKIEPGTWLCASDDGFAVPGDELSPHLRVGKAIRHPSLYGNKWVVEAFVFIGRGEDDMALAELATQFKTLDVRIGADVKELKEGQECLSLAIDRVEKRVGDVEAKGPSSRLECKSTVKAGPNSIITPAPVIKGLRHGDSVPALPEVNSSLIVHGALDAKKGAIISSSPVVIYESNEKKKKKKKNKTEGKK
jgi:hypothetical protein